MVVGELDWWEVLELFMLLLIGIGPKIALVPFIGITAHLDQPTISALTNKAVRTAIGWALILAVLGWFLMKLLHFSPGSALVAGGIVLLLLSLHMLVSGKNEDESHSAKDPMEMALYPIAVPYILNPVGIAVLVIYSSQITTIIDIVVLATLILAVGLIDWVLFRNIKSVSKYIDPSKMAVTEAVFGVLLAALAIELMAHGLDQLGIVSLPGLY